jgi:hypothetical protein
VKRRFTALAASDHAVSSGEWFAGGDQRQPFRAHQVEEPGRRRESGAGAEQPLASGRQRWLPQWHLVSQLASIVCSA